MTFKGNELVEKRNILNEVRKNSMSLQELRFFSIYLSKINARDISTRIVRFPLKDFQKIMEFGRLNTTQLKATTDSLLGKVVSIPTERGGYKSFQLFKECTVDKDDFGQWYVEIDAHDNALPLMFDFKDRYFTYELWNALRLKSSNHLRMYELLKQYERAGERKITLAELRELIGIGANEYPRWDRFKDRIIDGSQEALAENTDICFDYEPIKAGRKVVGVHFFIKKNPKHVDQLSLSQFIDQQANLSDKELEGQTSLFIDTESDSPAAYLRAVVGTDFSDEELESFDLMLKNRIPGDSNPEHDSIFVQRRLNFLKGIYATYLSRKNNGDRINGAAAWLCGTIEKKKLDEDYCFRVIEQDKPSYNVEEFNYRGDELPVYKKNNK